MSATISHRQADYQRFLKTDFWKNLADAKKLLVGQCEECGSTENLEAHHVTYPSNWFDSTQEHLQVLCRKHHRKAHGLPCWTIIGRIFPYSPDERFNRFMHWTDYLRSRIILREIPLRDRERRYLCAALENYPPTKSNRCMAWHVAQTLGARP